VRVARGLRAWRGRPPAPQRPRAERRRGARRPWRCGCSASAPAGRVCVRAAGLLGVRAAGLLGVRAAGLLGVRAAGLLGVSPPGAALRSALWSRFGNEGREPGGPRPLLRACSPNCPGSLPESESYPGQVANLLEFAANNEANPRRFAPARPGVAKDTRSATRRPRESTTSPRILSLIAKTRPAAGTESGARRRGPRATPGGADAKQPRRRRRRPVPAPLSPRGTTSRSRASSCRARR
jgi:hypothetical protein